MIMFPGALIPIDAGWVSISSLPRGSASLKRLREAGAKVLLSLTEPEEEAALSLPDLTTRVTDAGLRHIRLPIPDFSVPPEEPPILDEVFALLREGGHVAVHCRAGCGRSGMITLRLMVMAGEEPNAALIRLRSLRPCAVETGEQRLWAGLPWRVAV